MCFVSLPDSPWENPHLLDPVSGEFRCEVADYECSVGIVGTKFWRAPEILLGLKNRNHTPELFTTASDMYNDETNENITPELFTKASDMYSYGMTCYEIITGRFPFELEGFKAEEYDRVIGGYRLSLPRETPEWMKDLVRRCWHENQSERPTFREVEADLVVRLRPSDEEALLQ